MTGKLPPTHDPQGFCDPPKTATQPQGDCQTALQRLRGALGRIDKEAEALAELISPVCQRSPSCEQTPEADPTVDSATELGIEISEMANRAGLLADRLQGLRSRISI